MLTQQFGNLVTKCDFHYIFNLKVLHQVLARADIPTKTSTHSLTEFMSKQMDPRLTSASQCLDNGIVSLLPQLGADVLL